MSFLEGIALAVLIAAVFIFFCLERIASALEALASCTEAKTLQMRDVDRAKVYKEHLGEKLRDKGE